MAETVPRTETAAAVLPPADGNDGNDGNNGNDGNDGDGSVRVAYHQFFTNKVCSVRFGPKQDSLSVIFTSLFLVIGIHLSICFYCTLIATPSAKYEAIWDDYFNSNQFLVGGLLYLWIMGFNVVSFVIYRQFELIEVYPADDFYIASSDSSGREPVVLRLPDERFALGVERA